MSAQLAAFKVPVVDNEPLVTHDCLSLDVSDYCGSLVLQKAYAPGSPERAALQAAIAQMEQELPFEVPIIINGDSVRLVLCIRVLRVTAIPTRNLLQ